jgi:hypothetical protein
MHPAEDSNNRKPIRSHSLVRIILLVPLIAAFSLFIGSCAKRESEAERNAEIDRRVQQRLEAEHRTEEEQKLAHRQAELETHERALAAKESSFATMAASITPETLSTPADAGTAPSADSYSTYPGASGAIYPEQYGFVSANEPYVAEDPYFFAPATPFVTILNQNTRIVCLNRNPARAGCGQHHPGFPSGVPCGRGTGHRVVGGTPRVIGGTPMRAIGHQPTGSASSRQVVTRRPATRLVLPGSR